MTWKDWADFHRRLFGLTSEADAGMLATWVNLFHRAGYTPEELQSASERLALGEDAPKWRGDHPNALSRIVRSQRTRQANQGAPADMPVASSCRLCGDTGMVTVPNPTALARGRYTEAAVLCRCPLGLWKKSRDKRGWQTLTGYEGEVPDWREIAEQHRRELLAASEATQAGAGLDRILGPILERMKGRQER